MSKRKIINTPVDQDSKLNASGEMIIKIAHRQLEVLMDKMASEQLHSDDIRKFDTLTKIVNSQQKHRLEVEKMQKSLEEGDSSTHNHLHISEDQIKQLLQVARENKDER